jgi:predicted DNA-binding protein
MASVKVTYTLDQDTVNRVQMASERLSLPKSQVIREAVEEYYERIGKLSERERIHMLRTLDTVLARPSSRSRRETDRELKDIRRARQIGGRKTVVEK